jgi:hypothetical protein
MTSSSFADTFFVHYPALKEMSWDNLAIRGGAVVDVLLGRTPTDLDLFMFGLESPEACVDKAREVLNFLLRAEKASVEEKNKEAKRRAIDRGYSTDPAVQTMSIKAVRKGCVVTVWVDVLKCPIQIVLCNYSTFEEVVRGVDLSVSGASFDGSTVWVSEAGKWALENMAIRVETDDYFPSAVRLEKYFNKGFDIVLPGLDVAKLSTKYHQIGLADAFVTPSFTVSYTCIAKNKILVNAFHFPIDSLPDNTAANELVYDDENGRMNFTNAADSKTVLYANIEKLAGVSSDNSPNQDNTTAARDFHVYAEADFVTDCLAAWPKLTSRQVENTLEGARHGILKGSSFNFVQFEQFVKAVDLKNFFGVVLDAATKYGFEQACTKELVAVIEKQKEICNSKLPELTAFYQDKLPPVLTPENLFKRSLPVKGANDFYGEYMKD